MKNIAKLLENCRLFQGIEGEELTHLLTCLDAREYNFSRGSFVWMQGDSDYKVGIVTEGKVNIIKEDLMGNRSLIASISAPHIFGESLVSSEAPESPVSVQAAVDSKILLFDFIRLVKSCGSACTYHTRLIQNMMKILAGKNIYLNEKIDYLSRTTTRQKVSAYLLNHITDADRLLSVIPLNREELADYLGVNRSALSRELSLMRSDGLISFKKDTFSILDYAAVSELVF